MFTLDFVFLFLEKNMMQQFFLQLFAYSVYCNIFLMKFYLFVIFFCSASRLAVPIAAAVAVRPCLAGVSERGTTSSSSAPPPTVRPLMASWKRPMSWSAVRGNFAMTGLSLSFPQIVRLAVVICSYILLLWLLVHDLIFIYSASTEYTPFSISGRGQRHSWLSSQWLLSPITILLKTKVARTKKEDHINWIKLYEKLFLKFLKNFKSLTFESRSFLKSMHFFELMSFHRIDEFIELKGWYPGYYPQL